MCLILEAHRVPGSIPSRSWLVLSLHHLRDEKTFKLRKSIMIESVCVTMSDLLMSNPDAGSLSML